ncbi:MAG: AmmeMemoRadiSam system protein B [Bacteroidales bacterium]|nr:AmmeMemoRadiSam system protein B [Bacteroidales bacterium]
MFGKIFTAKGQSTDKSDIQADRQPCVAGQFYPENKSELRNELKNYFANAIPRKSNNLLAIVTPHAGYVFSGQIAAHAFNQIDPDKKYDRIFLIGSSHRTWFEGASIYNIGNYKTPLGIAKVDKILADKLIQDNQVFEFREDAHLTEHSLEVQLPFLQYHLNSDFKIVPIIIATQSEKTILKIAEALKPYFNSQNLFVISSDFSHYPNYEQANHIDRITADAIASNSPQTFVETLKNNETKSVPGLATSMCGWSSMLTVLNLTQNMQGIRITPLVYQNSGDAIFGDKSRVVGYWAISIYGTENIGSTFTLNDQEKKDLLAIARNTIEATVKGEKIPEIDTNGVSAKLKEYMGAFVSLHNGDELRGCIGRFNPEAPLFSIVQDMAISAATKDQRFTPVQARELSKTDIEISVLTPMKRIENISEIELGRHGIYIKKGYHSGTFLPQVADNTGWTLEEFLGHCARDKAGIGWDGWKTAEIFTYEAIIFDEKDFD